MIPDAICGHNREALHHTLKIAVRSPWCISEMRDPPIDWQNDSHYVVMMALSDPAKLAAIIVRLAVEGGRFGLVDYASVAELDDDMHTIGAYPWHPSTVSIHIQRMDIDRTFTLDMPKARAFALALLDAPNATVQDVERMIGEATQ